MDGKPFHRGEVINLAQGDKVKDPAIKGTQKQIVHY